MKLNYGDQPLNRIKKIAPLPIEKGKKNKKIKKLVLEERWSRFRVRVVKIQSRNLNLKR